MRFVVIVTVLCTALSLCLADADKVRKPFFKKQSSSQASASSYSSSSGKSQDTAFALTQVKKKLPVLKPSPKAVSIFDQCFKDEIKKCKLASAIFDIEKNITREEFQAAKFYLVAAFSADAGSKTSAKNADAATKYMTISKGRLTSDFMSTIYGDSMGRYLDLRKALNEKNAAKLAKSYAQTAKAVAKELFNPKYPRSRVTSLPTTYATFLEKEELFSREDLYQISRDYGLEWKYQYQIGNNPSPSKYKVPSPESKEPNPLIKECDNVCKINDKAVNVFHSVFRNAIRKSSVLLDLCNPTPSVGSAEASRGLDYMSQYILRSNGAKDIAILADFMSRYVRDIKNLTPNSYIEQAKYMPKYLLSLNVLNIKNAKSLAEEFARNLEAKANLVVNKDYPKSKIVAIILGKRDFLIKIKAFEASMAQKLAYYYGNEWRCVAAKTST